MDKKILVVCGNGIASSSIMVSLIEDYLKQEKIEADVQKASLMDCTTEKFNSMDLIVSSTKIDNPKVTTKVIVGAGLLTGLGDEEILEEVKDELTK